MLQPDLNDGLLKQGPPCRLSVWKTWIVLTAVYIPFNFLLILVGRGPSERSHYAISYVTVAIGMFVPSVVGAVAVRHLVGILALPAMIVVMVYGERWASSLRLSCMTRLGYNLGVLLVATLVVDLLSSYQWTSVLTLLMHDPLRGSY